MNYSDDGRTLDYDMLKQCYPLHENDIPPNISLAEKAPKNETSELASKSESKMFIKGPINSSAAPAKGKKSLIHRLDTEDLESASDSAGDDEEDWKKSKKGANSKIRAKAKKDSTYKRKKLKVEGGEKAVKSWNEDEAEVDSTRDTSTQSVASEVLNENINKNEIQKSKGKKRISKTKKQKKAVSETLVKEVVIPAPEEKKRANYLINAIPCFFEKFRTENMYSINRSFYFDPINLSL